MTRRHVLDTSRLVCAFLLTVCLCNNVRAQTTADNNNVRAQTTANNNNFRAQTTADNNNVRAQTTANNNNFRAQTTADNNNVRAQTTANNNNVRAQTTANNNNGDPSNSSSVDIFEVLNNLDIPNVIRGMQQDGSLVELAAMVATGASSEYQIDGQCMKSILTMVQGVINRNMWAIQMLDAIGKPHSGILSDLDFKWMGSFDECIGVEAVTYSNDTLLSDPVHHFDGKYCTLGVPLPTALTGAGNAASLFDTRVKIGVCIPDVCNTADMKDIMMLVAKNLFNASTEYEPDMQCQDGKSLPTKSIVAICVLSVIGLLVVIGTLYDIGLRLNKKPEVKQPVKGPTTTPPTINGDLNGEVKVDISFVNGGNMDGGLGVKTTTTNGDLVMGHVKPPVAPLEQHSTLEKMFLSFSVYSNGLKILSTNQPKGALTCINGIRFFSMTWVILGHSADFEAKNAIPYYTMKKVWQWTFYGIYSATVSVDTFFTLSGLLVSYLTLRELSKRGGAKKMNWFMFYFHRYWRLTPAYMLTLMVYATLAGYFVDGPKWPVNNDMGDRCEENWWTNLLYINNYVNTDRLCMGWSWYLSNDMQFYILSPLIIVPLYYNVIAGGVVAFVLLAITTAARAVVAEHHHYTALVGGFIGPRPKDANFMDNLYLPAHTRMGPYIVGLVAGYLLYRYKDSCKMKKTWNLLGWFSCMSTIVLIIYGVYPDDGDHYLSVNESVAYVALHRTAWGMAVSWIIFACATGHGGWINDFLSWSPFAPLGRLSYCAYLVHLMCMQIYTISVRQNIYITDFELIYYFIGNVVISYFVAFGTSLLFEAPMMGLEKVLFKRT